MLHKPEISLNTGTIGRTCVVTNTALHLVRPYGFLLGDKYLKHTGMDYWRKLSLCEYDDYTAFLAQYPEPDFRQKKTGKKLWFATTKAEQTYVDANFGPDDYIMSGKGSVKILEGILAKHRKAYIRIPVWGDIRSLNLSGVVAVILYEVPRQQDFAELEKQDALHRLCWETGTEY